MYPGFIPEISIYHQMYSHLVVRVRGKKREEAHVYNLRFNERSVII
jgi:hypothetical protein